MMRATPFQVMLGASLLLLALLALGWMLGDGRWQPPAGLPPAMEPLAAEQPMLPEMHVEALAATRERPLFWSGRRPFEAPASADAATPARPDPDLFRNLRIVGLVTEYAQDDMVDRLIVRLDKETMRIKVGESIGDWTLVAVTGMVAHFERDGEVRSLSMEHAK